MSSTPEPGDIIVVKSMQKVRMAVESVDDDSVDCGINGEIPMENVVRVVGKSPSHKNP